MAALAIPSSLKAQNIALVAEHLYTMDAGPQGGPGMVLCSRPRSLLWSAART
jgi:hypothetical protein